MVGLAARLEAVDTVVTQILALGTVLGLPVEGTQYSFPEPDTLPGNAVGDLETANL